MAIPSNIVESISKELELNIRNASPLGGGCIHHANRIETQKGTFFLKYNHLREAHNFEVESQGLQLLAETQTLHVPKVIGRGSTDSHTWLALEFIDSASRSANYWQDFGRKLALLHRYSSETFGLDYDNYIGALPQQNNKHKNWINFFIQERIQPMLDMAISKRAFGSDIQHSFDKLFQRLPDIFPEETPALLHGDLWGGNIVTNQHGEAAIIDPAVYFGHREIELAFMTLFDRQPQEFYDAYEEVKPLSPGWWDRLDLYNLYPLLVHVNLFGGGYASSVKQILQQYV